MKEAGALKFQPITSGEQRVDVRTEGDCVVIELSTWESGLGWCLQKTMRLDPSMAGDLGHMLGAARLRMMNRSRGSV